MNYSPVLVVGAGVAGLCTSLFLSMHGVRHIVVEESLGSRAVVHPLRLSKDNIALLKAVGVDVQLCFSPHGSDSALGGARQGSVLCSDSRLIPLLRRAANRAGADLRFRHRFVALKQMRAGALCSVMDQLSGRNEKIYTEYVIGADGRSSAVALCADMPMEVALHSHCALIVRGRWRMGAPDGLVEGEQRLLNLDGVVGVLTSLNAREWVLAVTAGSTGPSFDPLLSALDDCFGAQTIEVLETTAEPLDSAMRSALANGRVAVVGDAAQWQPNQFGVDDPSAAIADAWVLAGCVSRALKAGEPSALNEYSIARQESARDLTLSRLIAWDGLCVSESIA